ncbi:hypothetical protein [Neisseria sp. CCUG12390]|uniref:hypothetical protein n=1 Tax=Neisseria sp. CCUG12390 TaxID=3392035 RepID=UPI003A103580
MNKLNGLLVTAAVLALTACANQNNRASSSDYSSQAQTASTSASTACRSIGEGRKINNKGQNDGYMCKASVALNSAEAKEVLSPNIRVSYGSTSGKTNVSRQIANAVGKSPDETCQRAFLSAVKRFQSTAERYKKGSVRLVSYFDKKTIGGSEYECHIGTWNSRVVLKGSFH